MDRTTKGTTNPVVESRTVWIAWAWGGIVAGNNVYCYIGWTCVWSGFVVRWLQKRITVGIDAKRHMARDGTWVRTVARWWAVHRLGPYWIPDDATETWRCVNLHHCSLDSRRVDALWLNVRMWSPLVQIILREEKKVSSHRSTSTRTDKISPKKSQTTESNLRQPEQQQQLETIPKTSWNNREQHSKG